MMARPLGLFLRLGVAVVPLAAVADVVHLRTGETMGTVIARRDLRWMSGTNVERRYRLTW